MANVTLKVSTQAMRETADAIKGELSTLKQAFEKLDSIAKGTATYWQSDAADKYRALYASYKDKTAYITKRLDEQVQDLGVMAGVYEQTEQKNSSVSADLGDDIIK